MPAYVAIPPFTGPVPGVIVIHDAGGLTQDARSQADWLAEAGFLAVALNLYYRGGLSFCVRTIIHDLIVRSGPTFTDVACADIKSAHSWLSLHPGYAGRVGIIGFCMGGAFALLLASEHGFSASSVNYGGKLPAGVDSLLAKACPIVASYGAKDRWNRGVAGQLERALERARIPHDVKEYPNAGHSFMNNHQSIFFKAFRFAGIAYDEQATLDARRRIIAFFQTHLQP
jgi:carboxymethylenebutenolidase